MRVYADTSFLLKFLVPENRASEAVDIYRSMEGPVFQFTHVHGVEVANAIRQRAFHQERTSPAKERLAIKREINECLGKLERYLGRGVFRPVSIDFESACDRARSLSQIHTERLGCRGFDLLHVAFALELECEVFVTGDQNQAALARAEGLDVRVSGVD